MQFRQQFRLWQLFVFTTAVCIMCAFPSAIGVYAIIMAATLCFWLSLLTIIVGIAVFLKSITRWLTRKE
jgi:hypothetical protein